MDFSNFLPKEEEKKTEDIVEPITEKINQNQVYDVITNKKADWQTVIYDLISSEQLDPWDINISILTNKYFEKILELEDDPDFYTSSKVLLAATLLLRIKSEFLLNKHIKSIDEILFGKKEETKTNIERIEIDESQLPLLIPKTPLPRSKKVTLQELMEALNKAMNTESRRIKREISIKRARKLSSISIPKFRKIDLKDRIKEFYTKILSLLKKPATNTKIAYSHFTKEDKDQKLAHFLPLLHLSNSKKLWLEQTNHLDEIWIYLYEHFEKNKENFLEDLETDIEEMKKELETKGENIDKKISGLEKAREKREEKKQLQEDIKRELEKELGTEINDIITEVATIEEQGKIEEVTGFSDE